MALGNLRAGISAEQGAAGNLIEGNLSSGNEGQGILLGDPGSAYNSVVGNIVGLDATGTTALENAMDGIYVGHSPPGFNRVGGTLSEDRNIVSGNRGAGILVTGDDHFALGNDVGTDAAGTHAVPNHEGILLGDAEHIFVGVHAMKSGM